ncbi:MAG: hypothetical protein RL199_1578 [Pseudomonadota bacterium]|jgi:hypothetical protein
MVGGHQRTAARTFIVLMGIVSLFGDMTYEGARGLLGPYLAMLGASAASVGFVAGLGEFVGDALRLVSGQLAHRTRAWWTFVVAGYAMNIVAVPGLALAGRWEAAACLVLLERVGKAVRSPARSTLVSHAATAVGVGWSFGLEEALDQVGAITGPLLTAAVLWGARGEPIDTRYRLAFGLLLLPALANLALVLAARRRYPRPETFEHDRAVGPTPSQGPFRLFVAAAMLFGLGFADWALVAFHASRTGHFGPAMLPVLYAGVMGVDGLAALGVGRCFDRHGLLVLAAATIVSAAYAPLVFLAPSGMVVIGGAVLWGVGMGVQESVFKAAVARLVPKDVRARAYGVFFAWFGLAWWVGSAAMGWLYDRSIPTLIGFSVVMQLGAAALFAVLGRWLAARESLPGGRPSVSTDTRKAPKCPD